LYDQDYLDTGFVTMSEAESEEEVYEETTTGAIEVAIGGGGVEPEAEAPSPAPGVEPLADWVEELLGRLAAGDRLSASNTVEK
jgi:hypothetical protein